MKSERTTERKTDHAGPCNVYSVFTLNVMGSWPKALSDMI